MRKHISIFDYKANFYLAAVLQDASKSYVAFLLLCTIVVVVVVVVAVDL